MKKIRLFFACFIVMLLLPTRGFAESEYTADLDCEKATAFVGDDISISINVEHESETVFSSAELVLFYDSTKLSFVSVEGMGSGAIADYHLPGTIVIEDCGEEKALGDKAYTVNFSAIEPGETVITLDSAAFSNKNNAEIRNLIPATVDKNVSITVVQTDTTSASSTEPTNTKESENAQKSDFSTLPIWLGTFAICGIGIGVCVKHRKAK